MERNKKKKFITIFPKGKNVHLVKDVGMIPYVLQKEGFYESTISFYEDKINMPYFETEVKGVVYTKLKKTFNNDNLNILWFLLKNYKKFDVVMLLHPFFDKAPMMVFIKLLSLGRLKFYGKLDTNHHILKNNTNKRSIRFLVGLFLYKWIDLLSVESKKLNELLNKETFMRTKYIPNGFLKKSNLNLSKENLIITVGRIGILEKNNQLFLKSLSMVNLRDWKVKLIGPVEESFKLVIQDFYNNNPSLRDVVELTGNIDKREELERYYARAKVFTLTSIYEGSPLVFTEALSHGCFIISTDLTAAYEITDNEKYGKIIEQENEHQLAEALQRIIDGNAMLPEPQEIASFAQDNFSWEKIARKIYGYLENKQ